MVLQSEISLFLAWNDDTGEIMEMNSDKLEWFWNPVEIVGETVIGTYGTAAEAATAMWSIMPRIEQGALVVIGRRDGTAERSLTRWTGETWVDPLEPADTDVTTKYGRWQERCRALGQLTQDEVVRLVAGL
jgi:hypothetical protein